jgi:hypothetical protein
MEPGIGTLYGKRLEIGRTGNSVTDDWFTISFDNSYANTPNSLIGQIQTNNGGDPVSLRYKNLNNANVKVFCEEEKSSDRETDHTTEVVGYMVLE